MQDNARIAINNNPIDSVIVFVVLYNLRFDKLVIVFEFSWLNQKEDPNLYSQIQQREGFIYQMKRILRNTLNPCSSNRPLLFFPNTSLHIENPESTFLPKKTKKK